MNNEKSEQDQAPNRPPVKPAKWPKTIGIIAIIFGIFGGLKGLVAIVSTFFGEMLAKASNLPPEFYDKWRPFMLGSGAGEIILGILLFVGGLLLLYRKRFSMVMLMGWAVMKMLFAVVGFFFNYQMQREQIPLLLEQQQEAVKKAGGAGSEQVMEMVTGATEIISTVMLFAGLIWVMLLPIFILIWFIRPKIMRQVSGWGREVESND